MKLFTRILVFVLFLLSFSIFVPQAHAMSVQSGPAVYIPKGQTVTGTLFAGGNTVTIDGIVHGDVICGSQSVVITGTVDGDVICGAQTLRIEGTVGGSVRAAGQTIEIAGPVKRNVTVLGQTVVIDATSTVGGDLMVAGQQFTDNGPVAGSVVAAAEHAFLDAKIGGDTQMMGSALTLGDNAKIGGSLTYESKNAAVMAPTATVSGTISHTLPKEPQQTPSTTVKKAAGNKVNSVAGKIVFYLVFGAIIVSVAPKRTKRILDLMRETPVPAALVGFIALIVVPVVIIALILTLIGIPFAIVVALLYALAIVAAEIYASLFVGRYIFDRFHGNRQDKMLLNLLVGVPVACVLFAIPILGGLASFLGVIWGLGAVVQTWKK